VLALEREEEILKGPSFSSDLGRETLEIGVPIANPDPPRDRIGKLILVYDWDASGEVLDAIRIKLANLGKNVAAMVVDASGKVIGGVSFDGEAAQRSALAAQSWRESTSNGRGDRLATVSAGQPVEVLVGAATLPRELHGWSVVFIEGTKEALAPVAAVRTRWIIMITCILLIGLAVAWLLGRQFMRPLDEVTRATSMIASHPNEELPLLPVRSKNEVGQLTESFNKMTTELKRSQEETLTAAKFAFAGELAAMVAHEVRTPLSVMRSSAQMLAAPATSHGSETAELAETIVAEVDRVERVVTGLIQLARPVEQRLETTWLREILSRAADFVATQASKQNIRLTTDFDVAERPALCDAEQIYQVVLNLVVNALQALPPGGSIRLRTFNFESSTVGFEVSDDGPGLPHELRERLFQPFVTGREGGTGLGLAFVDRIVKAHRGSTIVHSETGRGTTFEVHLPAAVEGLRTEH
jgi:signal transduction histidine kinase